MELIHTMLNLIAPPATFFALLIFLPPFYFFKLFLSTISSIFSENVAGKVVLITGASSGIGEQLAYQYAIRGACLVLVARREDRLRQVAERARGYGSPDVLVICADVAKMDDCRRFIEEAVNHFGQLNHLVNNAGISSIWKLEDASNVDNFRPIMDINFWGSIYPTYFAIPHLRKNKGKIVVTASFGGWVPIPRMAFYNASKAAVINFFECLRTELSPDVGVTIVTPGITESEITQGKHLSKEGKLELDQELRDSQFGAIPIRHAENCARGIVNGVCRGDKNITEPAWFKVFYYWKVFCPQVVEWFCHAMVMKGPSERETLARKILDFTGAKSLLYPSSIQELELRED